MEKCSNQLQIKGLPNVLPEDDGQLFNRVTPEQALLLKRELSRRHLRKIRDPRTFGILVVNPDKNGRLDYIGPNTFAEIAVAFAQGKAIYLLQGYPSLYEEELEAWGVIRLDGDLDRLARDFHGKFGLFQDQQALL